MDATEPVLFNASRLATFKGKKLWPHKSPAPAELAQAGFYYKPSAHSNDNAICFLCDRALDGWEEDDDPIQEHLKHSPDCGWAVLMSISQDTHDASTMEDPTHPTLTDARRATFAPGWPHESKRGWTCKTEKMVEAGWYFAPTSESEDFVTCAYCKLSLDGWEPKDSPFDEHYRRSPDCPFFAFAGTAAPKTGRGKKPRISKAARLSTQPAAPQTQVIPDLDESIDTSTISIESTASAMGAKKPARGRNKAKKPAENAQLTVLEPPSVLFEEPAYLQTAKTTRGKKRTSEQISDDDHRSRESTARPEPPPKRRNTRSRTSVALNMEDSMLQPEPGSVDIDAKPARTRRKRASSTTRKTSLASIAALRAGLPSGIPDDAAIEAALEADLEKPLSDEELLQVQESEKPKRRIPKMVMASKAALRAAAPLAEADTVAREELTAVEDPERRADADETDIEDRSRGRKPRATKKTATKKTTKVARLSSDSTATVETYMEHHMESSAVVPRTVEDDSGHESDASVTGKGVARKASKRKATAKPRSKKAGNRVVSKTFQSAVDEPNGRPAAAALATVAQPEASLAAAMDRDEMSIDGKIAKLAVEIEQEDAEQKKARGTKGGKGKPAKPKAKKEKVPQLSMPGAFSPLAFESAEPSFASALSPTSPPMKSGVYNFDASGERDVEVEVRSPEEQTTPTPKRIAPPQLPERSSARPTPTPTAKRARNGIPIPSSSPLRSVQRSAHIAATASPNPEMSPGAQSSNAENAPPSSRPEAVRPPLAPISPIKRVQLVPGTPTTVRRLPMSPSKIGGGLKSSMPWSAVDVDLVFNNATSNVDKENLDSLNLRNGLTSPEKKMSVEEWICANAERAEADLKREGERIVGAFESEGRRAMDALEGIQCS